MPLRLPLSVRAFAKINLTLRVFAVRPDGYHELRTVFQSVDLHDRLTFALEPGPFTIECDDPACPVDGRNLIWRAAEAVWRAARRRGEMHGIRIALEKRIPMQAGLGGGSSDAAATLRMLAAVWAPALPASELEAIGASLGADIPFFFRGGTVLGVERGDRLFPLADGDRPWVVLAQPDFGVSTADAYRWFDASRPAVTAPPATAARADLPGRSGRPAGPGGPFGEGGNDLEAPVAAHHPPIGRLVKALARQGAHWSAMSGSGSVCFGLFSSKAAALRAATVVRSSSVTTWVTRAQTASEYAVASAPFKALPPTVPSPGRSSLPAGPGRARPGRTR